MTLPEFSQPLFSQLDLKENSLWRCLKFRRPQRPGQKSYDPEVFFKGATSHTTEVSGRGHAFSCGRGNGERSITFTAHSKACIAGGIFDKNAGVDDSRHFTEISDVTGMHHGCVSVTMLYPFGHCDSVM